MKAFPGRHKPLTAVVLGLIFLIWSAGVWDPTAAVRGRMQARYDLRRGHYVVLGYGLPAPYRPRYAQLLRARYGVEYRAVAGCMVSEALTSYVGGYNSVSVAAANAKFGRDIFEETFQEAKAEWEQSLERR